MTITNIPFDPPRERERERAARRPSRTVFSAIDYIDALEPMALALLIFAAAFAARGMLTWLGVVDEGGLSPLPGIAACAAAIAAMLFRHGDAPSRRTAADMAQPTAAVARTTGVFAVLAALILAFDIEDKYPPAFILTWYATSAVAVPLAASAVGYYVRHLARGETTERVAIYGRADLMSKVALSLMEGERRAAVMGFYDDPPAVRSEPGVPLAGGVRELIAAARSGECDRIVVALPISERERIEAIMAALEVLPMKVNLCSEAQPPPCTVRGTDRIGSLLLLNVQGHPLGVHGTIVKTMFDYLFASLALVVLAPVMAAIAIAIKLDSRGPVFFVQSRGGYRDSVIRVIKFRTMTVLEDGPVVVQATRGDKRITRVGRFLRRTSLDELPQLFNVLKGDLSLVGPRPHALVHDQYYREIVNRYASRQKMKPGITGWAQVNGLRSETADPELMCERVKHDLFYIENWSPWLDLKILIRTVAVIFFDKKAY